MQMEDAMKTIENDDDMKRHRYVAQEAPALLGKILSGTLAGGGVVDPEYCASLAYKAAAALFDELKVTGPGIY